MCRGEEGEWIRDTLRKFKDYVSGPIIDVGSRYINGNSKRFCNELFPNIEWIGIDKTSGNCVTIVSDAHYLPFKDESVGTVISTNTIEHLSDPIKACNEMKRILKPNGLLILIVPAFGSTIHHEAGISINDLKKGDRLFHYWLISEECMRYVLLADIEVLTVEYLYKDGNKIATLLGCGKKSLLTSTVTNVTANVNDSGDYI